MTTIALCNGIYGIGKDFVEASCAAVQADIHSRYRGNFTVVRGDDGVTVSHKYVSRLASSDTHKALEAAAKGEGYRVVSFTWQACD